MEPLLLSRREFTVMAVGAAAAAAGCDVAPLMAQSPVTAQQIIDRVHRQAGAGWPRNGSAGLKAGSPDTQVRGIVATSMATVDVLRLAIKSGANLIFTCEPTFFGVNDGAPPTLRPEAPRPAQPGGQPQGGQPRQQGVSPTDPIFLAKKALIEQNGLVVYRIGDHWSQGEDLSLALASSMGWAGNRSADDPLRYTIPARPLGAILTDIRQRLGTRGGLRVIGDSRTMIQRVAVLPGLRPLPDLLKYLPQSDMLLLGESRDWEGPEYALDADFAGLKKAYAQIGRVVSEDPGMAAFSKWLATFVKEVPVTAIPAMDPFWRPA